MRSLQLAQGSGGDSDGKSAETLTRLALFRNFYMATISYVYVTRFLLYILASTLPYNATWFAPFADEFATLVYYCLVGYYFRPSPANSYLKVGGDDDDDAPAQGVATGAAAGTLEGSASAVQTVAVKKATIDDEVEDFDLDTDEEEGGGKGGGEVESKPLVKPVMKQVNKEGR
jgi:hypothetical protein